MIPRVSTWFRSYGFAEVADQLLIGAYPLDGEDVETLVWLGIERVLNLVEDEEYRPGARDAVEAAMYVHGIEEKRQRLTDFGGLPADELERAVTQTNRWLDQDHRTYVHCRAGWQRSAAVAAGVVAVREGIDVDAALDLVQIRKPSANPLPHQREDLRRWWDARQHRVA
jgi:protein-tyrosine phosphatase